MRDNDSLILENGTPKSFIGRAIQIPVNLKSQSTNGANNSANLFAFSIVYKPMQKAKLGDVSVRYGFRRRTAFDNNTTNAYDTNEQTLAVGYNLTKQDNISIAYKLERRNDSVSSEYNTKGIYYTRSF